MRLMRLLLIASLLLAACGPTPAAQLAPTVTVAPTRAPTATPRPNYGELRGQLIGPVIALQLGVRHNNPQEIDSALERYNAAADHVLLLLRQDNSRDATTIRSTIARVRSSPRDPEVLDRVLDSLDND